MNNKLLKSFGPIPALLTALVLHSSIAQRSGAAWVFTSLHNFSGGDGAKPQAGLTVSGNILYGVTDSGGTWGTGAGFIMETNGANFSSQSFAPESGPLSTNVTGANPDGTLVASGATLYGTTYWGGACGNGSVFAFNGGGASLHSFAAGAGSFPYNYTNSDGACPEAGMILAGSTLYGTTEKGGGWGLGAVFRLGTDGMSFTNLHSFNGADGSMPEGLVISGSTLYGATVGVMGTSTVFKVSTSGNGFATLHTFTATNSPNNINLGGAPSATNSDGGGPTYLVLAGNRLYGTAWAGGNAGNGTVFALNTDGTGFTNLHSFARSGTNSSGVYTNTDGIHPIGTLVLSGDTLYGTAFFGGSAGDGTVFAIKTNGAGFTTVYSFTATNTSGCNSDGAHPYAGLVLVGNTLYGTAKNGGSAGDGSVFSLAPAVLHVATAALPNGIIGVAYTQQLSAVYGQAPYSWSLLSGAMPPGVALSGGGSISGTPGTNGNFNFTVQVTDALSATATQLLTLTVYGPLTVTLQPTNGVLEISAGGGVTLSASASGVGPFSYQWRLNGTNLPNGIITTVAGNGYTNDYGGGDFSGDGGPATNAELNYPYGVTADGNGSVFFSDSQNARIRMVGADGVINTIAGGWWGYWGDGGAATNAALDQPWGVAVDSSGNLFIADWVNNCIRKVDGQGIITTVAGNGTQGYAGDGGVATTAELNFPSGIAVDGSGNLFIADSANSRVRKVGLNGIITTVAGGGSASPGDGGSATNAQLSSAASGVAVDTTGNLFVADADVICKVDTNGTISTVAGGGFAYPGNGGAATNAELMFATSVAVDASGNLFIADYWEGIRKVGTDGIITMVAGNGTSGYSGDGGAATNSEVSHPSGVAVDASGNVFIADTANQRVREVFLQGPMLALNGLGYANAGAYDVVVTSPYGSVTSSVVNLTVTAPLPFTYRTYNGAITITGYTGSDGAAVIPGIINGMPVTSIGVGAFENNGVLTNAAIPAGVTNIGYLAFVDCPNLVSISMDTNNPAYSSLDGVLFDKGRATLIAYPPGRIGTSYAIPSGVKSVVSYGLAYNSLAAVTVPASLTNIQAQAFYTCYSLTSINVDAGNAAYSSINGVLFDKKQSSLVMYPEGLAGAYTIPNGVTSIADDAFNACYSLTGIIIPNSVTAIGAYAFFGTGLSNVTLPASLGSIAGEAFGNCIGLTGAYFQGNAPGADSTVFTGDWSAIAYYLPGTGGWGESFGGIPTAAWLLPNPMVINSGPSFGVRTNRFGFIVSWATNLSVVVEACTNLANAVWQPVATNALVGGWCYFNDPQWTNYRTRFYRLKSFALPLLSMALTNNTVTVTAGSNLTLAVSVSGPGPFSYQWQLNGTNLPYVNFGAITTLAGNGSNSYSGDFIAATDAELNWPNGVAVDAAGNVFIADYQNNRVREVKVNGLITTIAGNGVQGYSGDGGAATNAALSYPLAVALDAGGNLFIADSWNSRIRKVNTNGIITTVAGNGLMGYLGDGGAATDARLYEPAGVTADALGNVFIADLFNNVIRKVDSHGIITTVAGNGDGAGSGYGGYSGDGGAATNAEMYYPSCTAVDGNGNLFIGDSWNHRIRKVDTNGVITTVAGNGENGFTGDGGPAINAKLYEPEGVVVDRAGNLFIADYDNCRIRKVGTNGIITTIAGNGVPGYSGDGGLATEAELYNPSGLALDSIGRLIIADELNNRVRGIGFQGPTLLLNGVSSANAGSYDLVVSNSYGSVTSSIITVTLNLPSLILSTPQVASGTYFSFLLSGPAGGGYVLQFSTNLVNWSSVSTSSIPSTGSVTLTNIIGNYKCSFYRAYSK